MKTTYSILEEVAEQIKTDLEAKGIETDLNVSFYDKDDNFIFEADLNEAAKLGA